jgi:hypothetical protein
MQPMKTVVFVRIFTKHCLLPFCLQGDASLKGGNAVEYLTIGVSDNPAVASGATYFLFVELVDTKRPATDVMRLKMRTWAGSVSITGSSSGLNMSAPTVTPHVNSEGGTEAFRFCLVVVSVNRRLYCGAVLLLQVQ